MGPRIAIGRFRRTQLARILEIESACFHADAYNRELFLDLLRDCGELFFVAKRGGRIAGYMVTGRYRDRAEIVSIAVDPRFRGEGVGRALMKATLRGLRRARVRRVSLLVRPGNTAARRFYRSFGFVRVRTVPRYYSDGDDGILMGLNVC